MINQGTGSMRDENCDKMKPRSYCYLDIDVIGYMQPRYGISRLLPERSCRWLVLIEGSPDPRRAILPPAAPDRWLFC